jgi:hypothetical protein
VEQACSETVGQIDMLLVLLASIYRLGVVGSWGLKELQGKCKLECSQMNIMLCFMSVLSYFHAEDAVEVS